MPPAVRETLGLHVRIEAVTDTSAGPPTVSPAGPSTPVDGRPRRRTGPGAGASPGIVLAAGVAQVISKSMFIAGATGGCQRATRPAILRVGSSSTPRQKARS